MASRVLGLLRDAMFVALFGANWLTDAYVIAFRIPNLLRDLFAEGALSAAFVPTFSDAFAKDGQERAFQIANRVLTGVLLCTSVLTLLGVVFADQIAHLISDGFRGDASGLAVTALLTRVMMPMLILISVSAVFMGILNSRRRYGAPAYAPALFNLTSILSGVGLYFLGARGETGILVWALATTAAAGVQAVCQLPSLFSLGYRPRLDGSGLRGDPAVRRIVSTMAPASIGLAAIQVNVFANTHFAAQLAEGTQALMQCAFRLFYLPVGVFGVALAVVTTTRVADDAARGDRQALRERTAEGGRAVWMLALGSAVGLMVLAEPVLTVLFERGMFSLADVRATVPILRAYMLGVLPYSLVKIYAPAFYALGASRLTMMASLIAVAANIVWSVFTFRRLGATGLAFGTTLAAVINCVILRVAFGRLVGPPRTPGWAGHLGGLIAANVVMGGVAFLLWQGGVRLFAGSEGRLTGVLAGLWLLVTIAGGFLTYAVCLKLLRYPGGEELLGMPRRIIGRLIGRPAGRR